MTDQAAFQKLFFEVSVFVNVIVSIVFLSDTCIVLNRYFCRIYRLCLFPIIIKQFEVYHVNFKCYFLFLIKSVN